MSDDPTYEKAFLDLSVKITEMAGDIKMVLLLNNNSDEKHRDHSRRLDKVEESISAIHRDSATTTAQAITPKKMWAAIGVLTGLAAVLVAVVAVVVSLANH